MKPQYCCDGNCNQGRDCPYKTYKSMKTILITIAATVLVTTTIIAASTYLWLQSLPKVYSCQKTTT